MINMNEYFENYVYNNYTSLDKFKFNNLENEISNSIKNGKTISLNFDGGFGYTTKFIEMITLFIKDSFTHLNIGERLEIISNDEPSIIDYVYNILKTK